MDLSGRSVTCKLTVCTVLRQRHETALLTFYLMICGEMLVPGRLNILQQALVPIHFQLQWDQLIGLKYVKNTPVSVSGLHILLIP